jgi:hypothetical protein
MPMTPRLRSALALVLVVVLAPGLALGERGGRDDFFVPDPEPGGHRDIQEAEEWREGRVDLPPWPKDEDLVELRPDLPESRFRFFLDGRNLSRDAKDAVVRYTLVAESASGARNVSFEGIRCTLKGAYRVYAYGTGGRFSPIGPSDWQPIPESGAEAFRHDLARHRFCVPRETRPRTLTEIRRALKDQGTSQQTTGFQAD